MGNEELQKALDRIKSVDELLAQNPPPGTVPVSHPVRPVPVPLNPVPETPPVIPSPFKTTDEYIHALEEERKALILEIDNRTMREKGTVPFSARIPDLLKGAIGSGIIAFVFKILGWL